MIVGSLMVFRCIFPVSGHFKIKNKHITLAKKSVSDHLRPHLSQIGIGFLILLTLIFFAGFRWDLPDNIFFEYFIGLLVATVAPGLAIGAYIYSKDHFYKESIHTIVQVFFLSLLMASLAGINNTFWDGVFFAHGDDATISHIFFYYMFVVGGGEELVKFLAVYILVYRKGQLRQVFDGILFCSVSALGFATIENVAYVFTSGTDAIAVAISRAMTAVPSHVSFGVVMGYGLGKSKSEKSQAKEWIVFGYLGAVMLHGFYDIFIVGFESAFAFVPMMLLGWWIAIRVFRKSLKYSPFTHCGSCQNVIPQIASFCPHCKKDHAIEWKCEHCNTPLSKWSRKCGNCNRRVHFPWHLEPRRLEDFYPQREFEPCRACKEPVPLGLMFCLHCGRRLVIDE